MSEYPATRKVHRRRRQEPRGHFTPQPGGKWQVTAAGGEEPFWRRDGKELFYIAGRNLMAVEVSTYGPVFQSGIPRPLFELRLESESRHTRYQVAANGQRFLVNQPLETSAPPITVVLNWKPGSIR